MTIKNMLRLIESYCSNSIEKDSKDSVIRETV